MKSESVLRIIGEWRTIIRDTQGRVLGDSGWRRNQVQNTNAILLASLIKNAAGISGVLFWAYGEGQASWDSSPPVQLETDTTLTSEVFRKAVTAPDVTFRDSTTFVDIDPTPSNVIQIDQLLGITEANGYSLREFGLFGGTATTTPDSGLFMNWVVHDRIDKDNSISVQRSIRFLFQVV
mgnify:CR=1 FL=1